MDPLDAFIHARRRRPFEYFGHDCAHLAAAWVRERTGADPLAPLYQIGGALAPRRLITALRYVRAAGGFVAVGDRLLGPSVVGAMARRGDVVLVASGRRPGRVSGRAFGICTGTHVAAPGPHGLEFLSVTSAEAAWRL